MTTVTSKTITITVSEQSCNCPTGDVCETNGTCPSGYVPDPNNAGCCVQYGLPAEFNIAPGFSESYDVTMLVLETNDLTGHCYYVGAYSSTAGSGNCCGAPLSGNIAVWSISGQVIDYAGNPVPNQAYALYLENSDPYMTIVDLVTYNKVTNPSFDNRLNAQTDSSGYMSLELLYSYVPPVDTNSGNYPTSYSGCTGGNTLPDPLPSDTIEFVIPNTAVSGKTLINITVNKHYFAFASGYVGSGCPPQCPDQCVTNTNCWSSGCSGCKQ